MPRKKWLNNQGVADKIGYESGVALGEGSAVLGETSAGDSASLLNISSDSNLIVGEATPAHLIFKLSTASNSRECNRSVEMATPFWPDPYPEGYRMKWYAKSIQLSEAAEAR